MSEGLGDAGGVEIVTSCVPVAKAVHVSLGCAPEDDAAEPWRSTFGSSSVVRVSQSRLSYLEMRLRSACGPCVTS